MVGNKVPFGLGEILLSFVMNMDLKSACISKTCVHIFMKICGCTQFPSNGECHTLLTLRPCILHGPLSTFVRLEIFLF